MSETTLTVGLAGHLAAADPLADFGRFLRLHAAEGDASPHTIRSYQTNARAFVAWCQEIGVNPAAASEGDVIKYRSALVGAGYARGTVGVKLAAVRRLFEALAWRGLRTDNPAAGVKAPKDRTAREERIKFLPLDGLKKLLTAPKGDGAQAVRDRAMLALMGVHGLRVSEVAGLDLAGLDLEAGTLRIEHGKGEKARTIYLVPTTADALAAWLTARPAVALPEVGALFVVVGNHTHGTAMSTEAIRYSINQYLENCNLKREGISCHSLRHSAATWARAGGATLDALAGMLGHANVATTQVYAKIVDQMTENPARYLEAVMRSGPDSSL